MKKLKKLICRGGLDDGVLEEFRDIEADDEEINTKFKIKIDNKQ
jgi:hypothetical protein